MVKCPRGTPAQIKANLAYLKKADTLSGEFSDSVHLDKLETSEESDNLELDSNKAYKRELLTARNELVHCFISAILDVLIERYEGKPCYKSKLKEFNQFPPRHTEEFGEMDIYPCEYPSTFSMTAEYINGLYTKRSSTLGKEYSPQNIKIETEDSEIADAIPEADSEGHPEVGEPQVPDEEAHMTFLNGSWYKGRVSRHLMEGEGTYFWADGTCYTGDFVGGCATGKGRLNFPCLSVYEGGVYKAFRHGEGMHCMFDSPVMYTGQWWLGKKHGEGLIVYDEPSKGSNFYQGQFVNGIKEGFGFRLYSSGAKYIGFWSNGQRHGKGVMLWKNGDIYRGQWKDGVMHGYGEYTWNGFINKTLSYPAVNMYRGYWTEGKRSGRGTFETMHDGIVETMWTDNVKSGPGAVVCENATSIIAESLYQNDKPATLNREEDNIGLLVRDQIWKIKETNEKESREKNLLNYLNTMEKFKTVSIPIHSSICSIDLSQHVHRFINKKKEASGRDLELSDLERSPKNLLNQLGANDKIHTDSYDEDVNFTECAAEEEKYLRNAIIMKMPQLKACYDYYATLACEEPPPYKCIMLRLFLWQMLIDCNIPSARLSLIDIDDILARESYILLENIHDPFERIRLGQFIHILIVLSWNLYGEHIFYVDSLSIDEKTSDFLEEYKSSEFKYILQSSFNYFIDKNVLREENLKKYRGEASKELKFFDGDLAPMESMYKVYRRIGEPHTAREFLNSFNTKGRPESMPEMFTYFDQLPSFKVNGKNALILGGELIYVPEPPPFNFPELTNEKQNPKIFEERSNLIFRNGLKAKHIVQCLSQVCPSVAADGLVINMDYQLTFLEFYNTVILCTEFSLKLNAMKAIRNNILQEKKRKSEKCEKLMNDQEKMKEVRAVSSKRLRQATENSKKGKNN